ncbi:MAG: type I-C CRISPR-associated protein Cas8c/Csd1, partial [Chlorobi bacterium]|nr:type I-C CRISPR-associated protein Cas8c/Csd1 [Chlorobiota bacterium]
ESICLITGRRAVPARLHPAIKGVRGANANGASLVSFNDPAFCSYGKEQSYNSPVSGEAAFAYTTALNILLERDSRNKVTLGEAVTIVYWSDGSSAEEYDFEGFFGAYIDAPRDNPDQGVEAVKALYDAMHTGKLTSSTQHFYVLGLAPNAGRIAVRFFRHGPTYFFARNIYQHFEDLQIVHGPNEPEHLPLYRLLASTAVEHKIDNVPPNLPSAVIESILDGTPYPLSLLQACIRRMRAERVVRYEHAAILKAWLNRYHRLYHNLSKEITMTLDTTNTAPAYVLGRLFAVLERIQESAQPGINATIRERFYGAASASPAATFPRLLKLANHHLAKIENTGLQVSLDKQLGEVMSLLDGFPLTLPLHDQALFALGYYHQRQAFFTPKQSSTVQTQQHDSQS